ncbi:LLM class flavin-dependent oxidoreductase [Bacillus sp. FSL M8-0256]|uniref:LLM class flavin-dependent oxidoreductase n=1 Tax=Bacillus TaxID=1386 RepID=UPI0022823164|nr:LLM class flavin-dependent oxidoreductase [Bacillus safensis]MCY7704656.1 LLM class flavin-dependent oxidoreductase [Bacillus safensis]MCY7720499.1 LLM class flavin-dependent oxidoreductase [Bacillus safensis]MED0727341.1 LLM class flavin-dependent oxidoreductase [Bacillus safensis]
MKLSILDQSPLIGGATPAEALKQTVELAKQAEKWGYHRFWVSEHHFSNRLAGSSPEVLLGHLSAVTSHIRIGSGGVMLPHYSAYKVAENFRVLEALAPGRIDLGIGRAPGGMPISSIALHHGERKRLGDQYPEQVEELKVYLHDLADEFYPLPHLTASPKVETAPEVWMLGSSGGSARLAAKAGAGYTFALFINGEGGEDSVEQYIKRFEPSVFGDQPRVSLAVFVLCAETEEQAEKLAVSLDLSLLANEQGLNLEGFPSYEEAQSYSYSPYEQKRVAANRQRMVIGTPASVKKQLTTLAKAYRTDELIAVTITHHMQDRLTSYRLLKEAFDA